VVHDAAVMTWPADKKKPKVRQLDNLVGRGAMTGSFWGFLFGLLFVAPLLGAAIGAAVGALGGKLADLGIDDDFIDSLRAQLEPGTSALFVLSSDEVLDRVTDAFGGSGAQLVTTNLSAEQEIALHEAFG